MNFFPLGTTTTREEKKEGEEKQEKSKKARKQYFLSLKNSKELSRNFHHKMFFSLRFVAFDSRARRLFRAKSRKPKAESRKPRAWLGFFFLYRKRDRFLFFVEYETSTEMPTFLILFIRFKRPNLLTTGLRQAGYAGFAGFFDGHFVRFGNWKIRGGFRHS